MLCYTEIPGSLEIWGSLTSIAAETDDFAICIYTILPCSTYRMRFNMPIYRRIYKSIGFSKPTTTKKTTSKIQPHPYSFHNSRIPEKCFAWSSHRNVEMSHNAHSKLLLLSLLLRLRSNSITCIFDKSILSESEVIAITFNRVALGMFILLLYDKQHLQASLFVRVSISAFILPIHPRHLFLSVVMLLFSMKSLLDV